MSLRSHKDWVEYEIRAECLLLPIVPLDSVISFETASSVAQQYEAVVDDAVAAWSIPTRQAVVECLLTVYVAENYTGQLSDEEILMIRPMLDHLMGFPIAPEPPTSQLVGTAAKDAYAAEVAKAKQRVADRDRQLRALLSRDGEPVWPVVARPALLLAARAVALTLPASSIWRLRTLYRHLVCLQRVAHSIYVSLMESAQLIADAAEDPLALIEVAFVRHQFNQELEAADAAFKAVNMTSLVLQESAMLGVRTRWQQHKHLQSLLIAQSTLPAERLPDPERQWTMPNVVEGEKDGHDLYDRPRESSEANAVKEPPLAHTDHAIILALSHNIRNSNPLFGLTTHQVQVYVERLIVDDADPVYCLRAMSLLIRARVEAHRNRVAQRSFLQLQDLLDSLVSSPDRPALYRATSRFVWSLDLPPHWALKCEYASQCIELNMFKTALRYYEEVEDWQNIIQCCSKLDKPRRAETLAREKLKADPDNPTLWVALGEATRHEPHLWKAWELSGGKMAAPMRSLAKFAVDREQWPLVVEYFDKAVAINPLFGGDWFSLGFALLKIGQLQRAAEAFTRVCQMEADNPYAWTNLGNVLVKLGRFHAALSAMKQALRHHRHSWRMWGNYVTIAVHLKEVKEATHALHTALGIAGSDLILDDAVLTDFTNMALEFLRGEIAASGNVKPETDAEVVDPIPPPPVSTVAAEEISMEPLFEDIEREFDQSGGGGSSGSNNGVVDSSRPRTALPELELYRVRLRKVFDLLQESFATNPEVYACCAQIYGYFDGATAALRFRLKEVRESKKPYWERSVASFDRVARALSALVDAAEAVASSDARRQALEAIDAVLVTSADHMTHHDGYRDVQKLRIRASRIKLDDEQR